MRERERLVLMGIYSDHLLVSVIIKTRTYLERRIDFDPHEVSACEKQASSLYE